MTNDQNHTKTQGTRFHEYLQEREITEEQFHAMMKKWVCRAIRLTHHLMKQKIYEAIYELKLDMEKKKKEIENNQQKIEVAERRDSIDKVLIINGLLKIGHQLDTEKEQMLKWLKVFSEKLEKAGWANLGLTM